MPISESNALVIWSASRSDDDSCKDQADDGNDLTEHLSGSVLCSFWVTHLDGTEPKFHFSIDTGSSEIDSPLFPCG